MAFRGWLLLSIAVAFAVGATAADDDWDDEEGTSKVTAPFEVDGEVRHDWGQDNLREWDGAVFSCPLVLKYASLFVDKYCVCECV